MMTLLHGDNTVASRAELTQRIHEAKKQGQEIRRLDGRVLDATSLAQALESSSLFGQDVLVVVENLLSRKGNKVLPKTILSLLERTQTPVVVWEESEVAKSVLALLTPKARAVAFKTPRSLFAFLDSFGFNTSQDLLKKLTVCLQTEPPELLFAMLARRVRQLVMLADGVTPDGLLDWQRGRLTAQARLFTMEQLLLMHKKLLAIDVAVKNGATPFSLVQLLEQFLIGL